jgi:hypothetical protein
VMPARQIRTLGLAVAVAILAGCAAVTKVETGRATIRDAMTVQVDSPWNRFERGVADDTTVWTQEGITVDALQFYAGLKDGDLIAPTPKDLPDPKPLAFKSNMRPEQIAALFEALHTRDGSRFELVTIGPDQFVGTNGFRFEFNVTRKVDEVRLRGVAFGAVKQGKLYLISYTAPRLVFFEKYRPQVEAIARSAATTL